MIHKIHAVEVPKVEFEFGDTTYTFVYNLAAMKTISIMAQEGTLPENTFEWDEDHIRVLLTACGYTYHPDEDWEELMSVCSPGSMTQLSMAIGLMIAEENAKFGGGAEGEVEPTEPTPAPAKRRGRKAASTG